MQVFIPYADTLRTAAVLDSRRLHNQINEAQVILSAIAGASAWGSHPVVAMYRPYAAWLAWYRNTLSAYKEGRQNQDTEPARPPFIGWEDLHRAHRSRLYAKSPELYPDFAADADFADTNWYVADGFLLKYRNGKIIEKTVFSIYAVDNFGTEI